MDKYKEGKAMRKKGRKNMKGNKLIIFSVIFDGTCDTNDVIGRKL